MARVIIQDPNGTTQTKEAYDSVEFALATGQTDYDVASGQSNFKENIDNPSYVEIYTTQNLTLRFNDTGNHSITVSANALRVFDRQIANNIYLTNASGSEATVRLYIK